MSWGVLKCLELNRVSWSWGIQTDHQVPIPAGALRVTGRFGPIPVRTLGRFGPIPFRSGHFGLGCFGRILEVGRFGPVLVGCFGPLYFI